MRPAARRPASSGRRTRSSPAPVDHQSVEDAQYELTTAIRESASALAAADVARSGADVGDALHDARRAGRAPQPAPRPPAGAVRLLAQAERMQAVLDLALADPAGGAVDRGGIATRTAALRPLAIGGAAGPGRRLQRDRADRGPGHDNDVVRDPLGWAVTVALVTASNHRRQWTLAGAPVWPFGLRPDLHETPGFAGLQGCRQSRRLSYIECMSETVDRSDLAVALYGVQADLDRLAEADLPGTVCPTPGRGRARPVHKGQRHKASS